MIDSTPTPDALPESHKRSSFRSLRNVLTFAVVVILATIVLIYRVSWTSQTNQKRAAFAKIRDLGGQVEYYSAPSKSWFCNLLGIDYFETGISINFEDQDLSQDDFQTLGRCTGLTSLSLYYCTFEGKFLSELNTSSSNLKWLELENCRPLRQAGAWKINEAGEKIGWEPPTYNFKAGDPAFYVKINLDEFKRGVWKHYVTPDDKNFPHKKEYDKWKSETLPGVTILESFTS